MTKIQYVCGFLFTHARGSWAMQAYPDVMLIKKKSPKWQFGKLNGIGGKIEPDEEPLDAMAREFKEEAGVTGLNWNVFAILNGATFQVNFFYAWDDGEKFDAAETQTDEEVVVRNVRAIRDIDVIPNLRFLIPLALDESGIYKPVILTDNGDR